MGRWRQKAPRSENFIPEEGAPQYTKERRQIKLSGSGGEE
jgi:hypothetical protein